MAAQRVPLVSPQQYLAAERDAGAKSEYIAGALLAMAGGSPEHNRIAANATTALGKRIESSDCQEFTSDQRVRIAEAGPFFYPDVSVACDPVFDEDGCLRNPIVLIEVLSPSTTGYDRGEKWLHYRRLGSLQEFLLISTNEPRVEHYSRQSTSVWTFAERTGVGATLPLPALGLAIPLSEIYRRVAFEAATPAP